MASINEKLEKIIALLAKRNWRLPAKSAYIIIEYVDGERIKLPVYIGKTSQDNLETGFETGLGAKKENNKEKIYNSAPAKDEQPITRSGIMSRAGIKSNPWNRKLLEELVIEDRIKQIGNRYRKAT